MPSQNSFDNLLANSNNAKPWYATWWGVLILFVLLLILSFGVAFAFTVRDRVKSLQNQKNPATILSGLTRVDNAQMAGTNYSLGSDKPLITIVEFGDFTCEYTKQQFQDLRNLVLENSHDYKFIYRDLPILSQNSVTLARAGRCAGAQGLFWPMHDYFFQNSEVLETQEQILAAAQQIGANKLAFATCMEAEKYTQEIASDVSVAERFNIQGTPAIFINNHQLPTGVAAKDFLEKVIEEIKQQP